LKKQNPYTQKQGPLLSISSMKQFGITQESSTSKTYRRKKANFLFIGILWICFIFFSIFANISGIVFSKNKIDVFQKDINQIAFSFWTIDKNVSTFLLTLETIIQKYNAGENIFKTQAKEIDYCRKYIIDNKEYLKKIGFGNYEQLMNLLQDLWKHQQEVFTLLGKDESQNYLVILQNTNEKRPNGWFFWSFAFIKIEWWHIKTLEIVDSYYPDFIAYRTRILAPDRTAGFLPDRKIGFIAGNKFGFTDIDGKNLKDLYELMFNKTYDITKVQKTMQPDLYTKLLGQNIKGVVFIRSDLLEKIFPGFKEKAREREFVNAGIDLIRKEYRGNKKELYIKEIKAYFSQQKFNIIKNIINRFWELANNQYITAYISNTTPEFQWLLAKNKLSNVFDAHNIYFRDMNASYDKIDGFVHKNIRIKNYRGDTILDSEKDIIPIQQLKPGTYTIQIKYTLTIPPYYTTFIQSLEKKYGITLTDRELAILALKPGNYEEPGFGKVKKLWETKATVYFPKNIQILNVAGDMYYQTQFSPPFANGLFYQAGSTENNSTRNISIGIEVK